MTPQNEATDAAKSLERVIARSKAYVADKRDRAEYMENEQDCINLRYAALKPENAGVPAGYKLVPIELTDNMHSAFVDGLDEDDAMSDIYKAMLSAAPPVAAMPKGEWLPIEECPEDTDVVFFVPAYKMENGFTSWVVEEHQVIGRKVKPFEMEDFEENYSSRSIQNMTHWKPLDPPPAAPVPKVKK